MLAVVAGGAIAGLGGAVLSLQQVGTFTDNMTGGRGYLALASLIVARWSPLGAVAACLVFGAAEAFELRLADFWRPRQLLCDTDGALSDRARRAGRTRPILAPAGRDWTRAALGAVNGASRKRWSKSPRRSPLARSPRASSPSAAWRESAATTRASTPSLLSMSAARWRRLRKAIGAASSDRFARRSTARRSQSKTICTSAASPRPGAAAGSRSLSPRATNCRSRGCARPAPSSSARPTFPSSRSKATRATICSASRATRGTPS